MKIQHVVPSHLPAVRYGVRSNKTRSVDTEFMPCSEWAGYAAIGRQVSYIIGCKRISGSER